MQEIKNNHIQKIITRLYQDKREIQLSEATKYIKIINIYLLKGLIDYSLAYNLTFKVLMTIKPFYMREV